MNTPATSFLNWRQFWLPFLTWPFWLQISSPELLDSKDMFVWNTCVISNTDLGLPIRISISIEPQWSYFRSFFIPQNFLKLKPTLLVSCISSFIWFFLFYINETKKKTFFNFPIEIQCTKTFLRGHEYLQRFSQRLLIEDRYSKLWTEDEVKTFLRSLNYSR